jgi:Rrf2 family protein
MKLTHVSAYAVRALVHLHGAEPGKLVASHTIARAKGMPERYLLKILVALVRAGLVVSLKGPHGGYRLARPAKGITLLEVVEAVDGPVQGAAPQAVTKGDGQLDGRLQVVCEEAAEIGRRNLGRVSVAELVGKRKRSPDR